MIVGINWSHLDASYRVGVYYGLAAAVFYAAFILSLRKLQADQMGASFFFVLLLVSLSTAVFSKTDDSGELAGSADRPGSHLPGHGQKIGGRR
jgi:drug/metabolite transporter (DMT)-like permease